MSDDRSPGTEASRDDEYLHASRSRDRLVLMAGSVLWPSFLAAVAATGIFFSQIDPDELRVISFPALEIGRLAGYTIGFFMFWAVGALSSALTLILLKRPRPGGVRREPR